MRSPANRCLARSTVQKSDSSFEEQAGRAISPSCSRSFSSSTGLPCSRAQSPRKLSNALRLSLNRCRVFIKATTSVLCKRCGFVDGLFRRLSVCVAISPHRYSLQSILVQFEKNFHGDSESSRLYLAPETTFIATDAIHYARDIAETSLKLFFQYLFCTCRYERSNCRSCFLTTASFPLKRRVSSKRPTVVAMSTILCTSSKLASSSL
jgi:hypothetical protein